MHSSPVALSKKGPANREHRLCNWHSPALTFRQVAVRGVEMNCKDGLGAQEAKNRAEVRQGKRILLKLYAI